MKPKNVEPKKALQKPSMKRTITKGKLDDDQKEFIAKNLSSRKELNQFTGVNTAKSKKSFSLNESDKSIGDDGACSMPKQRKSSCNVNEKSKIGKSDTKITTKPTDVGVTSKQHDKNLEIGEQSESEESLISNSNKLEDDSQKLLVLGHYDEREHQSREQDEKIMKEVDQIEEGNQCDELRDMVENQTDAEDEDDDVENCEGMNSETESDTKSLSGDCLDGILSGFNKDIGTLYSKTDRIESDVKEIRRLLEVQQNKPCSYRSLSSRLKEESATSLLPKIPLGKKSFVRKMESDAGENDEYKKQMVSASTNLQILKILIGFLIGYFQNLFSRFKFCLIKKKL